MLNLHVLVFHVRVQRLQLAQLKKVCSKQSERLQETGHTLKIRRMPNLFVGSTVLLLI